MSQSGQTTFPDKKIITQTFSRIKKFVPFKTAEPTEFAMEITSKKSASRR